MKYFFIPAVLVGVLASSSWAQNVPAAQAVMNPMAASADTSLIMVNVSLATALVTASLTPVNSKDVARVIARLDATEINTYKPVSLGQVLEGVPGLDVRSRGGLGVQADLSIRGGSFEQTGLLINGVRWSAPHTGHHLMNIPLDPEDISRVEVLHGGSSPLWGSGAMTGAIHLISRPSQRDLVMGTLEGGQNGLFRGKVSAHFGGENMRSRVGISHLQSDGFQTNTDAKIQNFNYVGQLQSEAGEFNVMLGASQKAFGAQDFYTARFPTQYEETQTVSGQLTWRKSFNQLSLEAGVYSRFHGDHFELFREGEGYYEDDGTGVWVMDGDSMPGWYAGANEHSSSVAGGFAMAHIKRASGVTSVRLDGRNEAIVSNRLGIEGQGRDDVLNLGDSRQILDATLAHGVELNRLGATAYISVNAHSTYGARLLPGLDLSYALNDRTTLFASAATSVRHPSFTDLYYNIGGAVGSIDLESETANREEIGARYLSNSGWAVEGALFARQGSNLIDWVQYAGEDTTRASNLRSVDFVGGQTSVTWRNRSSRPETNGSVVRVAYVRFGAMLMQADETSAGFTSNYVLDFLSDKVDLQCALDLPANTQFSTQLSYQNRLGGYADPVEGVELDYSPVSLLGITLSKMFLQANVQAYVRVDNLLDAQYVDLGNVDQPGRWVRGGLSWFLSAEKQ